MVLKRRMRFGTTVFKTMVVDESGSVSFPREVVFPTDSSGTEDRRGRRQLSDRGKGSINKTDVEEKVEVKCQQTPL